ncbi:MAG: response regulator [Verrucomicrobia bacterium]|nr:response regulator [Verrucomicrobiota bacterium]
MGHPVDAARHRILLVDDDQDFLEVYWELLKGMPSQPEVHTASTAARALALLESAPFSAMIVDLHMPKMDGLQLLAIARRKHPQLRIVVLTAVCDEQFRARAYGMGVDQFWQKPDKEHEVKLFTESLEALLQQENHGGFRGVQSKSLVDIIQLECLSQASGVLKIKRGVLEARIWIQGGAVIDAEAQELTGEAAFQRILEWKTGSFEMLPPEPDRERKIFVSYQALLLESAQALDEAGSTRGSTEIITAPPSPLSDLTSFPDVQFVLSVGVGRKCEVDSWGLESPELVSEWAQKTLHGFQLLGDRLQVGDVQQVAGLGSPSHVAMADSSRGILTVGFRPALDREELRESMKNVTAKWAS